MEGFKQLLITQYKDRHILKKHKQVIPLRGDKLVKLQLVEGDKQEGYAAKWQRGKKDEDKRSPIERDIIFSGEEKEVKRILAEGEAGIGKSTFCTMLSEEWANEQLLKQFKLVLHLPLREKQIASAKSVFDLLKFFHKRVDKSVATEIEDSYGKDVLLILDGWDELSEENRQTDSFMYSLLVGGDELYHVSVLVTSRPSASADLHTLGLIDRCIEIVGFDEQTVEEYIESEFAHSKDPTEASLLLSELERNPLVASLCTVPLNCAIICFLWCKLKKEHNSQIPSTMSSKQPLQQLPSTMTDLYKDIVFKIILRDLHNRYPKKYKKPLPNLTSFDSLPKDLQSSWWNLCEFAFHSIEEDRLVFSHDELAKKGIVSMDEWFGLLQAALTPSMEEESFHFLHLTFQEYLAALHLVKQLPDSHFQYATSHRFHIVWRFFFGIAFTHKPMSTQFSKSLEKDDIVQSFVELAKQEHLMLCHCSFETKDGDSGVSNLLARSVNPNDYAFLHTNIPRNAHDFTAVMHVIAHAELEPDSMVRIDFSDCDLGNKGITDFVEEIRSREQLPCIRVLKEKPRVSRAVLGHGQMTFSIKSRPIRDGNFTSSFGNNNIFGAVLSGLNTSYPSNLQDLSLSQNPLSTSSVLKLADMIMSDKLADLKRLCMEGCLTRESPNVIELLASLDHCPELEWLDLSENYLSIKEAQALGKVVSQLTHHASMFRAPFRLHVNDACLGDKGICAFTQGITSTCNLATLSLLNNNIHGDGALSLANSITSGALSVHVLYLSHNPLGLGGALAVGKSSAGANCAAVSI